MSIFFVSIPKTSLTTGDSRSEHSARLVQAVADSYAPFLGRAYAPSPSYLSPSKAIGIRAICWEHRDSPSRFAADKNNWSIHAGTFVGDQFIRNLARRGGRIVFKSPVWGQYAAVIGGKYTNRVVAWNTSPALEAIHYAQNEDYIFISNRPMLLSLALAGGSRSNVQLSRDFTVEYLLYGYSMTGQTPFRDVHTLSADQALHVAEGRISFHDLPAGNVGDLKDEHTEEEAIDALADSLESAAHRSLEGVPRAPIQLRLSAGKDSRMLLGIMKKTGWDIEALTFGKLTDGEVQISKALADSANVNFSMKAPVIQSGETMQDWVNSCLASSDGMPPSEAQTSIYEGSSPSIPGEPISLGQWPLMKGGLAKRMRYSAQQIDEALQRQGASMVNSGSRAFYDRFLSSWSRQVETNNDLEKLYLFSRTFRSGRWLQAHVVLYDKDASIAYPISDSQVTAVSDTLTMAEKLSDRIYYGAQRRIAPELLELPLWGSTWRFKGDSAEDAELREHYTALAKEAESSAGSPAVNFEYRTSSEIDRAVYIVAQDEYLQVSRHLTESMRLAIDAAASGRRSLPEGMQGREFNKMLWRVFVITIWLKKDWLHG